jgi:hypothetical protein
VRVAGRSMLRRYRGTEACPVKGHMRVKEKNLICIPRGLGSAQIGEPSWLNSPPSLRDSSKPATQR